MAPPSSIIADISWQAHVRLCTPIRDLHNEEYDSYSEAQELRKLFERSATLPDWLRSTESPEYEYYRNLPTSFQEQAKYLHRLIQLDLSHDQPKFTLDAKDDVQLALDVRECLPHILQVAHRTQKLRARSSPPAVEHDYRPAMDSFGMVAWDNQSDENLIYLPERQLQIPALSHHLPCARPDACTFIVGPTVTPAVNPPDAKALTCLDGDTSEFLRHLILHWVTEYKPDAKKDQAIQQVLEGLVSGLYQRRAYGFTDHFVFGAALHTQGTIDVFAATWAPSDRSAEEESSSQHPPSQSPSPSDSQGPLPGRASEATEINLGDQPATVDTVSIADIMKRDEIVVYHVYTCYMEQVAHMLRLYLFMRQTRILAREYQQQITLHSTSRYSELSTKSPDYYRWPPQKETNKRSRNLSATDSRGSNKRMRTFEEREDDMASDQSGSSDLESDSDEPVSLSGDSQSSPVMRRAADYPLADFSGHRGNYIRLQGPE